MGQTKSKARSPTNSPSSLSNANEGGGGLNDEDILIRGLDQLAEPTTENTSSNLRDGEDLEDEGGGNSSPPPPSYYTMIKSGYNELVKAIIRPPRAEYTVDTLGPENFRFAGQMFTRTDCKFSLVGLVLGLVSSIIWVWGASLVVL